MVQKSGYHELRLVVFPIIYTVLVPSQVVIAGFLPWRVLLYQMLNSEKTRISQRLHDVNLYWPHVRSEAFHPLFGLFWLWEALATNRYTTGIV